MTKKNNIVCSYTLLLLITLLSACNSKVEYVDEDQFIGFWKPVGHSSLYDGLVIQIKKGDEHLSGIVIVVPQNKYAKLFVEPGDVWIKNIKRTSNFQFKVSEARIGGALLSTYGLDASEEFKVQFIDHNKFGMSSSSLSPAQSTLMYVRAEAPNQ